MNRKTFKGQLFPSWIKLPSLAAAMLIAAGCTFAFVYKPNAPIATTPPKFKAAVALVADQSPAATPADEKRTGHYMWNFSAKGVDYMKPRKMTDSIIEDLSASGLFISVANQGEGDADIIIKPVYKTAMVTTYGVLGDHWDLDMEIEVFKGKESLMKKMYARHWKSGSLGMNGGKMAQLLPELMGEIRNDLNEILKKL